MRRSVDSKVRRDSPPEHPRRHDPAPPIARGVDVLGRIHARLRRRVRVLRAIRHPDPAVLLRVDPLPLRGGRRRGLSHLRCRLGCLRRRAFNRLLRGGRKLRRRCRRRLGRSRRGRLGGLRGRLVVRLSAARLRIDGLRGGETSTKGQNRDKGGRQRLHGELLPMWTIVPRALFNRSTNWRGCSGKAVRRRNPPRASG